MNYFIAALRKCSDFSGRATRTEYWMFFLFYIIFYMFFVVLDGLLDTNAFSLIFSLSLLIPSTSIATRRLHDTSRTGWWQLIALIPIIGFIILVVFLSQESHGNNDYGGNTQASLSA